MKNVKWSKTVWGILLRNLKGQGYHRWCWPGPSPSPFRHNLNFFLQENIELFIFRKFLEYCIGLSPPALSQIFICTDAVFSKIDKNSPCRYDTVTNVTKYLPGNVRINVFWRMPWIHSFHCCMMLCSGLSCLKSLKFVFVHEWPILLKGNFGVC